jgi:hypothetical protein
MKISRSNLIILLGVFLFVGLLLAVTIGSKDSEENQLTRRLAAFRHALPDDIRARFDAKDYSGSVSMLSAKLNMYRAYTNQIAPEKRINFFKAEYSQIPADQLNKIPADLRVFYAKYYGVVDFECIPGFTVQETVDFFREYFVEKLVRIKAQQAR